MTDRDILLRYNVGDRKPLLGYKLTLDQALEKLRTHYREKIKRVLPKKKEALKQEESGGVAYASGFNRAIAAILKAIDKEMMV